MGWYKCNDCGHLFEDGEQSVKTEYVGDVGSSPAYRSFCCCPSCGSDDWEVACECKRCGGVVIPINH